MIHIAPINVFAKYGSSFNYALRRMTVQMNNHRPNSECGVDAEFIMQIISHWAIETNGNLMNHDTGRFIVSYGEIVSAGISRNIYKLTLFD